MNAVERVWQLVENVEAEGVVVKKQEGDSAVVGGTGKEGVKGGEEKGEVDDALLQQSGWPWKGGVTFRGAVMRYRADTAPILQVRRLTFLYSGVGDLGMRLLVHWFLCGEESM